MKFEIFQDTAGQWRFRIIAKNGEIVASSEGYGKRDDCADTVNAIKHNGINDTTEVELAQ